MRIVQVLQPDGLEYQHEQGEPRRLVNLIMDDGTQVKAVLEFEKLGYTVVGEKAHG